MSKVVFLDIDGVLNSEKFAQNMRRETGVNVFGESILDAMAIRRLRVILERSGADVVLSSSWRVFPVQRKKAIEQLRRMGVVVMDQTPYMMDGDCSRGDEIKAWLDCHPEVDRFVILDDDDDMGELTNHLVQTTFWNGLKRKHIKRALEVLGV